MWRVRRRSALAVLGSTLSSLAGCIERDVSAGPPEQARVVDVYDTMQWGIREITVENESSLTNSEKYRLPFSAVFTAPSGETTTHPGFWDGGDVFKLRFSPDETGTWKYETTSSEPSLDGVTGSFVAVEPTDSDVADLIHYRGHLETVTESDSRYFQFADGTPFLYAAGSMWDGNSKNLGYPGRFQEFIDDRQEKGMTTMQIQVGAPSRDYGRNERNTGINEGGKIFAGTKASPDYSEINPSSFYNFDKRINYIYQADMVPVIFFEWGHSFNDKTERELKDYHRYVIARYAAYNCMFCVTGEYGYADRVSKLRTLGRYDAEIDGHDRLKTIHPGTTQVVTSSVEDFAGDDWIDFHMQQNQAKDQFSALREDWNADDIPIVEAEPHVANNFQHGIDVRRDFWQVLNSGYAAGMAHLYYPLAYNTDQIGDFEKLLDGSETQDGARAYGFYKRIEWWNLRNDQSLVLSGQGGNDSAYKIASYVPDGSLELVYFSDDSSATIDISVISGSTARLKWYNPADGTETTEGSFDTSADPTVSPPPGYRDGVLIVQPPTARDNVGNTLEDQFDRSDEGTEGKIESTEVLDVISSYNFDDENISSRDVLKIIRAFNGDGSWDSV